MFDKNEELINVVDPEYLLESEQVQVKNELITTIVSAPYSKELENAFYIGSRDIDDNNIFWLYKVDKRTKENNNIILNGTYSLFDDLKAYDVIRDKRPKDASALVGITTLLEGSRWQVGNITSTHTGTANWYYVSRLEAFWEYLENWNVEFKPRMTFSKGKITGRYIDIVDKLSNDYGKWYEYGDKLLQVTAEQASDSLYTAFIGRGKGEEVGDGYGRRIGFEKVVWATDSGNPVNKPLNQDYVEIPSATELYGYSDGKPRTTVVIFENIEDPTQVLEQTYEYALNECRPKLQMKANVIETGLSELGETCTIIRDDRGIRYKTRVFKLTRDFLNKNRKTVEFGDEIVISTAKRSSNTAKEIKKQEEQTIYWLDSLRQQVVDSYFNEDGYNYDLTADNEYDLPAGYYSFDRPIDASPTKVVYMGAGKLMIADSKLPNGQWNWTTAIDGNGANLSAVNTGILQAGRIQSAVNGSFWDLDNGLMDLKSGKLTGANFEIDLGQGTMRMSHPTNGNTLLMQQDKLYFRTQSADHYIIPDNEGIALVPGLGNTGNDRNSGIRLQSKNFNFLDFGIGNDGGFKYRIADYSSAMTLMSKNGGNFILSHDNIVENNIGAHKWEFIDGNYGKFKYGKTAFTMNGFEIDDVPKMTIYNDTTGKMGTLEAQYLELTSDSGQGIQLLPVGTSFKIAHNANRNWMFDEGLSGAITYGASRITLNGHNTESAARLSIYNINGSYGYMSAANFDVQSERKYKEDITDFNGALGIISKMNIHKYVKNGVSEIGIITDEAPYQLLSDDDTKISLYDYVSLTARGVQELEQVSWNHEKRIAELESENKSLREDMKKIKQHLGLS